MVLYLIKYPVIRVQWTLLWLMKTFYKYLIYFFYPYLSVSKDLASCFFIGAKCDVRTNDILSEQ